MKKNEIFPVTILLGFVIVLVAGIIIFSNKKQEEPVKKISEVFTLGVCPPFYLLTEDGDTINPVTGKNTDKPYSPKQTCGKCHDYDKITQGFHFQQGKDETPTDIQKQRVQWASTPGVYGGGWCSPAPLYSYLSAKENENEKLIDLTSYTFVNKCGVCHPGGGPLEYDRNGSRYDHVMSDTSCGFKDGEKNKLDGDYYKARWLASGVIEADCYLCHLPQYSNKKRVEQIQKLNYRYAALAASGFGNIKGSVAANEPVSVEYNKEMFNPDGTVEPNIVKEPRNTACLWCHSKPGYKKRGADFTVRNDVHIRAGLKCVDCHPAGNMATDERIKGKEMHHFGKGDDPGGLVRDDLDNTMRTCNDCHNTGYLGAPIAKHNWLPSLHLDRISCQTCHIPERNVKSAHYVASDVFNPGTKIPDKGKYLWTFYGPNMNYWNHYGDLEMMGYEDKPTFTFKPELAEYKGMIYPVNRIHSSWPGILTEGKEGLMQPRMSDVYKMWATHRKDKTKYPELEKIVDDSGDDVIEVNNLEEIDALIASISTMLKDIDYPMENKQVVWVMNDRVYKSGTEYFEIPLRHWEAAAYGNVHKYSHDIKPARSALGTSGCNDCHLSNSSFFFAQTVKYPFDSNGNKVLVSQHNILNISRMAVTLGNFRESYLKPSAPWVILGCLALIVLHFVVYGRKRRSMSQISEERECICRFKLEERISHYFLMLTFTFLGITGFLFFLGKNDSATSWIRDMHGWIGWIFAINILVIATLWFRHMIFNEKDAVWIKCLGGYFNKKGHLPAGKFNAGQKIFFWLIVFSGVVLAVTGILMSITKSNPDFNLSLIYTLHDISALIALLLILAHIYLGVILNTESLYSIFGGHVDKKWLEEHHLLVDE